MNNISRKQLIEQELLRRGIEPSSFQKPVMSQETASAPLSRKDIIAQELSRRGIDVNAPSIGDKALGLAKGFGSGLAGGALDTAALIYNLPAMIHNMQVKASQGMTPEQLAQAGLGEYTRAQEVPMIPSAVEGIEKGIEDVTGIKTPEDMKGLYEGAKFAGELGGIGGLGKVAGKAGMKGLEKVGKELGVTAPSELAGAGAAGTAIHDIGEEYGPIAGLGAGAIAGGLTTKGVRGIGELSKGVKGTFTGKGETLGEMTLGRAMSRLGEANPQIESISKKEGFDLPFNIRLKGSVANFLANTGLNTIFTSRDYKNKIENAPKQVIDSITKRIDEISPENLGSKASSDIYQSTLKKEQEEVEKNASNLYNEARTFLKKDDKVAPSHTLNAIRELRDDLSAPVPSEPMKFVISRIENLGKAWDFISPQKLTKELGGTSEFGSYDNILKALSKSPKEIPVEELIQQRSAFMHDLRNKDAYGAQTQLGRIIKALDEDISTLKNQEFVNHWRAANSYFKSEVANRIRSDFARSLTEGEIPKQAYDYMTSPEKIRELKRILGDSPQVNQVMNSLKRAKLQDVLMSRIFNADGTLRYAAFSDMFKKGNKNQDLLKELLGNKSYKDLKDISEIGAVYSKAGKEFSNPSGTATRAQDLTRLVGVGSLLTNILTGGAGTGALSAGVGASIITPYVLSKILSNPRYTDAAVKYSMARMAGKSKEANSYQRIMKNIYADFAKKAAPQVARQEIESSE